MSDEPAGKGHNNPPDELDLVDITRIVDPAIIIPLLTRNFPELVKRRDEFVPGIERWIKAHSKPLPNGGHTTPVIVDEDDLGDALDYLRQLQKFVRKGTGEVETAKRVVKQPLLEAAAAVEGWFSDTINEPVRAGASIIHAAYTTALKEREQAEQAQRDAEVLAAREAAERLTQAAREATSQRTQDALLERAAEQEHIATQAQEAAAASPAELSRVRGAQGTVGGLRATWTWEVEDKMALLRAIVEGKESIDLVVTNDSVITALVKPKAGRRTIVGLRIYQRKEGR